MSVAVNVIWVKHFYSSDGVVQIRQVLAAQQCIFAVFHFSFLSVSINFFPFLNVQIKHMSSSTALWDGLTLRFTAVTALQDGFWVGVPAAGQAAAFLEVELCTGWADGAVERPGTLALCACAVTALTLGVILLQTENTRNMPFFSAPSDLT